MNEENTKYLHDHYPLLYRNKTYFECGDGWFQIINELSNKLEILINQLPDDEAKEYCYASQVKEKFGTLRLYMGSCTVDMDDIINEFERLSALTCEVCGDPGKMQGMRTDWIFTRCEKHR